MYIKNQVFKDEETLLEMLFDFSLGTRSGYMAEIAATVDKGLEQNDKYLEYISTLQDADERVEVYEGERDIRLAEILMERFEAFEVKSAKLYGVKDKERTLLFEIDMI